MRHGQGYHSAEVSKDGHLIRDPHLTEKGKEQCRNQCQGFARHDNIGLLVASPMRRAIQTCQIAFSPCLTRGLKILVIPHAEEVSDAPSDTGSEPSVLKQEFGDQKIDFDHLKAGWYEHIGEFATDPRAVNLRAKTLRRWLKGREEEEEIALVTHGFFAHFLTGDVDDKGEQTTPWWKEAELRTYTFSDEDDEAAMIYETQESLIARNGLHEREDYKSMKLNKPGERKNDMAPHQ